MNEIFKDLVHILLLFVLVWCGFYLYTRHDTLEQKMARYDCDLSEFAADYPPEVRVECRRRAIELYNQQQLNQKD